MRPVTSRFLAEIKQSHTVAVEVNLYGTDGSITPLEISDGSVNLNATSAVRASCDLTVPGLEWVPKGPTDDLAPYGSEINIRRGVRYSDGTSELVSLGWFGIQDAETSDDGNGIITTVSGYDRSQDVINAKFENSYTVASGTVFSEAILTVVLDGRPGTTFQPSLPTASTISIGRDIAAQAGDDRWEFAQGLAKAIGMSLYFDADGHLALRPYAGSGVMDTLVEGEDGVLVSAGRSWSRANAKNRWVVTGESVEGENVIRAVTTDENPSSPTYYNGPFGRCPDFYMHPDIQSIEQAQTVANSLKAQNLGAASTVNFGIIPNPALEPEDTVRITRQDAGINENHILDSVTIGLGASETMTGSTRQVLV